MRILQMVDVPWDSGLAHYALSLAERFQAQRPSSLDQYHSGTKALGQSRTDGLASRAVCDMEKSAGAALLLSGT